MEKASGERGEVGIHISGMTGANPHLAHMPSKVALLPCPITLKVMVMFLLKELTMTRGGIRAREMERRASRRASLVGGKRGLAALAGQPLNPLPSRSPRSRLTMKSAWQRAKPCVMQLWPLGQLMTIMATTMHISASGVLTQIARSLAFLGHGRYSLTRNARSANSITQIHPGEIGEQIAP